MHNNPQKQLINIQASLCSTDFLFGTYGLTNYIIKLFFPVNLSALYFYPSGMTGNIPPTFYLSCVCVIVLVIFIVLSIRETKKIFFGTTFFIVTILLVLQIIPVGKAIMADRYSYIPSIGLFYLYAELYEKGRPRWMSLSRIARTGILFITVVYLCWLCVATWQRCRVWNNGVTVWTDVIEKNPSDPGLYNNRGQAFLTAGYFEEAFQDFNKAIALKPDYKHALTDRGNVYYATKQYALAISDFNAAIAVDKTFALAYYDRANAYVRVQKFDLAFQDYSTALQLKPDYGEAFFNRGTLKLALGDSSGACDDFQKASRFIPDIAQKALLAVCR